MNGEARGLFWGWLGGFLGSSIAIPILAVGLWYEGDVLGSGLSLLLCIIFGLSALYLSPWRYPQQSIAKLYLLNLAILLIAWAVLLWRYHLLAPLPGLVYWQFLSISLLMLMPAFHLRNKYWHK